MQRIRPIGYRILIGFTFLSAFAKLPSLINFMAPGAIPNAGDVDLSRFLRQLFLGGLLVASAVGLVKENAWLARGVGTFVCVLWLLDLLLAAVQFGSFRLGPWVFPLAYLTCVHVIYRSQFQLGQPAA